MASIRLRYARGRGFSSYMIEWFGHTSGWSHVDAIISGKTVAEHYCIDNPAGGAYDVALGARMQGGVNIRPIGYLGPNTETETVEISCTDDQQTRFEKFLLARLGKPYDWRSIVAFALNRNWRSDDAWMCSELISAAEEAVGLLHFRALLSKITPDDSYMLNTSLRMFGERELRSNIIVITPAPPTGRS